MLCKRVNIWSLSSGLSEIYFCMGKSSFLDLENTKRALAYVRVLLSHWERKKHRFTSVSGSSSAIIYAAFFCSSLFFHHRNIILKIS